MRGKTIPTITELLETYKRDQVVEPIVAAYRLQRVLAQAVDDTPSAFYWVGRQHEYLISQGKLTRDDADLLVFTEEEAINE